MQVFLLWQIFSFIYRGKPRAISLEFTKTYALVHAEETGRSTNESKRMPRVVFIFYVP